MSLNRTELTEKAIFSDIILNDTRPTNTTAPVHYAQFAATLKEILSAIQQDRAELVKAIKALPGWKMGNGMIETTLEPNTAEIVPVHAVLKHLQEPTLLDKPKKE